jgi:hypothetical protein
MHTAPIEWVPCDNASGEDAPAFAVVKVTEVTGGVLQFDKPDADDDPAFAVLHDCGIPADLSGEATLDNRVIVAYDATDGTPAAGETWGVKAGNWKLRKNYQGFLILGGAGNGLVNAVRQPAASSSTPTVISFKNVVRAASTANGTLATAFENGDTLDGVVLVTGDRILLKNQTTASQNGIWVVAASGSPTRATDADGTDELVGTIVMVSEGTANRNTLWQCITDATITVGSTSTVWVELDTLLCEVTVTDTGSGHTVKIDTYSAGIAAISGPITLSPCYSGTGTALPVGMRVVLFHIPNLTTAGYWIVPVGIANFMLLAEVTVSANNNHTVKQKTWSGSISDVAGPVTYTQCRSTTATALPVGTIVSLNPVADSAGNYWITPVAYATATLPGLVSEVAQSFLGDKTFRNFVHVNEANTANIVPWQVRDGISASPYTAITSAATWASTDSLVCNVFGSVGATATAATTNPGRLEANAELRLGLMTDANAKKNCQYISTTYTSGHRIPTFKDNAGDYWQMAIPFTNATNNLLIWNDTTKEWVTFGGTDPGGVIVYDPLLTGTTGWAYMNGTDLHSRGPSSTSYCVLTATKNGGGTVTTVGLKDLVEYPGASGSFVVSGVTFTVTNGLITAIV